MLLSVDHQILLFDRRPKGYQLTIAGEALLSFVARIEDEINTIEKNILGQEIQLQGEIQVSIPDSLAVYLLMPSLVKFIEMYPTVKLDLLISNDIYQLTGRGSDVMILIANNPPEHLVGQRVAHYQCASYASQDYLGKHQLSKNTNKANWVSCYSHVDYPVWKLKNESPFPQTRIDWSNAALTLAAAKAGLGILPLPCFMGDSESTLQRVASVTNQACHDIWIMTHKEQNPTVCIQTFISFMTKAFQEKQHQLEGLVV